jgi:acyl-CoA reductase-like NAD-dependent aldehyde dehydrogenase
LQQAGIPNGAVNIVTGVGREVGDALVKNRMVQMITLTGSTKTGKHVAEICDMKKLHLELGGKGTAIIAPDADLKLAARKVLEGSLKYSGQRCDSISRVIVVRELADAYLKEILEIFDTYKLGNPFDIGVKVVPLINLNAAENVQSLVDDAIQKGAKLIKGGKRKNNYFEPTLLYNVTLDARIAWEETFGPVVVIISVESVDEAIEIVNKSNYGLDSCIFTNNLYTAWRVAKALEEGSVTINDAPAHGTGYFPFGGNKDSGLGREGIGYSLDEMTRIKTIQIDLSPLGLEKKLSK